jgi:hypothetical protein
MKLQNGFELEGNINYVIVTISNKPTQVLIIESVLEIEQLRELFKDNNIIVDTKETIENIYNVGGLRLKMVKIMFGYILLILQVENWLKQL